MIPGRDAVSDRGRTPRVLLARRAPRGRSGAVDADGYLCDDQRRSRRHGRARHGSELWTAADDCHEVVVDGTVAGGSKTAMVRAFEAPGVVVRALTAEAVRPDVDGKPGSVPSGTRRTVSHPARGAEYALFPSFGVDLDERPHPERGLWQAFAHTDFDPHRDGPVRLAQTGDGLLQVANPASTA